MGPKNVSTDCQQKFGSDLSHTPDKQRGTLLHELGAVATFGS